MAYVCPTWKPSAYLVRCRTAAVPTPRLCLGLTPAPAESAHSAAALPIATTIGRVGIGPPRRDSACSSARLTSSNSLQVSRNASRNRLFLSSANRVAVSAAESFFDKPVNCIGMAQREDRDNDLER